MRIARFLSAGVIGAVTNLGTFALLVYALHLWYVLASALAFTFSVVVSFFLQKFWTFQDHATDGVHKQALLFFVVSLFNLAVNVGLVFLFVEEIHTHKLIAQVSAALIIAVWSYVLYRKFVFPSGAPLLDSK